MTKYELIDQTFLDYIASWERNTHVMPSREVMQFAIFRMTSHIRNMHEKHSETFQAGVDYQKAMEKLK